MIPGKYVAMSMTGDHRSLARSVVATVAWSSDTRELEDLRVIPP